MVVPPPADPEVVRQGGDTIEDATVIAALPYSDTGTTAGYFDDYDEVCPYSISTSPDVVYAYTAPATSTMWIDLCGSSYDTKLYVYDEAMNLIACNDDYYTGDPCGQYVSALETEFLAGTTYYIVIDGYGGDFGDYSLSIPIYPVPCYEEFPDNEGEPPLGDGYVDSFNGGCDSAPPHPVQPLTGEEDGYAFVSGRTGWYEVDGETRFDTDWYLLTMGGEGAIEIATCCAYDSYVEEIGPQDCDAWGAVQSVLSIYWIETQMTITGYAPGAPVWLRVRPAYPEPPGGADDVYGYNLWIHGLAQPVVTEATSWSAVKGLYR